MTCQSVADPDFELRWALGFGLLALPAFLPSVISSFFTQNKGGRGGGGGPWAPPLDPPLQMNLFRDTQLLHGQNRSRQKENAWNDALKYAIIII